MSIILPVALYANFNVSNWLKSEETILYASELTPSPEPTATPSPIPANTKEVIQEKAEVVGDWKKEPKHTKDHIDYMKTIFGSEWKIAFAVAQNECNSSRKNWPNDCKLSTEKEHSIGWFQINLAQGHGKGAWIHASKVPGDTMKEKEEWLLEPKNNILMAKIIRDRSGWGAWSAYSSGNYLKDL